MKWLSLTESHWCVQSTPGSSNVVISAMFQGDFLVDSVSMSGASVNFKRYSASVSITADTIDDVKERIRWAVTKIDLNQQSYARLERLAIHGKEILDAEFSDCDVSK